MRLRQSVSTKIDDNVRNEGLGTSSAKLLFIRRRAEPFFRPLFGSIDSGQLIFSSYYYLK